MDDRWTLSELLQEAADLIAALPVPKNGQVRAVPDVRTLRYYATLGLIDKPTLHGRTAFYGQRQLAQVVSIKRLQSAGRSLAEIQAMWPTMDDIALSRMSGVMLPASTAARASRSEFWKRSLDEMTAAPDMTTPATRAAEAGRFAASSSAWRDPDPDPEPDLDPFALLPLGMEHSLVASIDTNGELAAAPPPVPLELRIQLVPGIMLSLAVPDGISLTPDDVHALRAAASPLVELASRQLGLNDGGDDR